MNIYEATDPFIKSSFKSMGWLDYLIGGIMIAIAIGLIPFTIKAFTKLKVYKSKQLDLYKKKRKISFVSYKSSGLYVPMGKRVFYFLPLTLLIVFAIIGITFLVGQPITQL